MIHLLPNTPAQLFYVSPFQARKFLPSFSFYLMELTNLATAQVQTCVLNVQIDNERYTRVFISTDSNSPIVGQLLLTESGLYTYAIYGQTNSTNLAVKDDAVVGLCETGTMRISDEDASVAPAFSIPDNVIYYE